jgi:hypothetical protein
MNEKIKLLAEQAGEYVNEVYTPPVRSKTPGKIWEDGHIDWMEQFNEKFAELIVRECAQVCVEVGDANSDIYPEFGNGAYFSANRVKQHFGVEE